MNLSCVPVREVDAITDADDTSAVAGCTPVKFRGQLFSARALGPQADINYRARVWPMEMNRQELLQLFALANEFKEGDLRVGGTRDERVRTEARQTLGALELREISATTFVEDEVSEALARNVDAQLAAEIS